MGFWCTRLDAPKFQKKLSFDLEEKGDIYKKEFKLSFIQFFFDFENIIFFEFRLRSSNGPKT